LKVQQLANRYAFPGTSAEWLKETVFLHLQWRDRAGFAPDFPIKPFAGA
jgi:hypothetical protein